MSNKVSVIIPMRNEENTISDCLEALYDQKEKPFEVIVIDNLSTDNSIKKVKEKIPKFRKKNIPLKIFSCKIGNQTNARDLAVKKSKGELIGSLDSDACPDSNWIAEIENNMQDIKIAGIGGRSTFRNKGPLFNFCYHIRYPLSVLGGIYCLGGGNSAFRRKLFFKVKGFEGLEKLRKTEGITHAKDDFYLSRKLETQGKLKYCPKMRVTLLSRVRKDQGNNYKIRPNLKDTITRAILEIKYDYKISRFFKRNLK
jgi:glycosyltransferase involved in cell wall biosynthesis